MTCQAVFIKKNSQTGVIIKILKKIKSKERWMFAIDICRSLPFNFSKHVQYSCWSYLGRVLRPCMWTGTALVKFQATTALVKFQALTAMVKFQANCPGEIPGYLDYKELPWRNSRLHCLGEIPGYLDNLYQLCTALVEFQASLPWWNSRHYTIVWLPWFFWPLFAFL